MLSVCIPACMKLTFVEYVCRSVHVCVGGMRQNTIGLSLQSRNIIRNWWKILFGHFSDSPLVERKMGRDEWRGRLNNEWPWLFLCRCSVTCLSLFVVILYHHFVAILNFLTQEVVLDFLFLCLKCICVSLPPSFALPFLSHSDTHTQMWDSCLLFLPSKNAFFSLWPALVLPDKCACVCGWREWASAKPSSLPECCCKGPGWQRGLRVSSSGLSIMS